MTQTQSIEQALAESARDLQRAQSAGRIGSLKVDYATGRWTTSVTGCEVLGLDMPRPRSTAEFLRLVHPAERECVLATLRAIGRTGRPAETEFRIVRPSDGAERHIRTIAETEFSPAGAPLRRVGTLQDVTIRVQADAARQRSEERFRALTMMASDWYWETDHLHRFTLMSDGGPSGKPRNFDPADLIGRTRWDFGLHVMNAATAHRLRDLMDNRQPFREFEYRGLDRSGQRFVRCISGDPVESADGQLAGYRGVGRDTTAENVAREALVESEEHYRTLVDASPEAIRVIFDGRIVMANPAAARLLGVETPAAMIGLDVLKTMHPDHVGEARERMRVVLEQRCAVPAARQRVVRKDGSAVWIDVTSLPFTFQGKPAVLSIARDISRKMRAIEEVQTLNQTLERRIIELTTELTRANADLETFSYSVAHDLRAPLRVMGGFASLLQDETTGGDAETTRQYARHIAEAASRMDKLVDGLLAVAHAAHREMAREPVALADLLERILLEHGAREHAAVSVAPLPVAMVDPVLMRQVWENLVANALKYSARRAHPEIHIGCEIGPREAVFSVRDNGVGFDPAHGHQLFGVFKRLHSQAEFAGTGVGLATVRRIVERHGGRIWAVGRPDAGATFSFTLPRSRVEGNTTGPPQDGRSST